MFHVKCIETWLRFCLKNESNKDETNEKMVLFVGWIKWKPFETFDMDEFNMTLFPS